MLDPIASFSSTSGGGVVDRPGDRKGGERDDVSALVIGGLREDDRGGDTTRDCAPDSQEFKRVFDIKGAGRGFSYLGGESNDRGGNEEYGVEEGSGREAEECPR